MIQMDGGMGTHTGHTDTEDTQIHRQTHGYTWTDKQMKVGLMDRQNTQ